MMSFLKCVAVLLSVSCLSGCASSKWDKNPIIQCNYSFTACPEGTIEKSYTDHMASVKKTTGNNRLPSPYDREFYMLNLDPFKETTLSSEKTFVIPCGDLPPEFRKDGLFVKVSGDQMNCLFALKDSPVIRYTGNALFNLKSVKQIH